MPKACAGEGKRNSSRVPRTTTPCPSPPVATRSRSRAASPLPSLFVGSPTGGGEAQRGCECPQDSSRRSFGG